MNEQLINEAISLLHSQHHEDLALEIEKLQSELERVKRIAGDRLDKIAKLRRELEDTQSELTLTKGYLAAQRSLAGQLALELAQIEDDPRRLEDSDDDSEDSGGLWGAHCRGEI